MKYLEWNNSIIEYFFNPENEEKEVILYFSEDIITEIGEKNFPIPEDGYINDFFRALKSGIPGTQNKDYIQRILDLENRFDKGVVAIEGVSFNYPPFLTYILAFLLPFTSDAVPEGFRESNFHDVVKNYFYKHNISTTYDQDIKLRLNEIDHLWDKIFDWLFEKNNMSLGYLEKIDNPVPNRKYVSKFEYHIIFRKEQEERLSIIFDSNNILPNELLEESQIKQILIKYKKELRLSDDIVNKIQNNEYVAQKLVRRAFNYYKNWDGTNEYNYTKNSDEINRHRAFSRKRLVVCLDFDILKQNIQVKYFRIYSADGLPEEFTLINSSRGIYKGIVTYLQSPLYSTEITECFQNLSQSIELNDNTNKIKYSWKAKEFYIFKRDSQLKEWVEIPQIEFNVGKTLIISKKLFYETRLKSWFEDDSIPQNRKKLYDDNTKNNLPHEWLALTIEQITQYQHPNLEQLKNGFGNTPKINFNKEFFFDACFYSDILPLVWIDNYEIENKSIFAEYGDGCKISLTKIDNSNLFEFTNEHIKRKNQEFKIKCDSPTIEYPRFLKIIDFDKKQSNDAIKLIQPKRNLIGNPIKSYDVQPNYFQGLEHCFEITKIQNMKPTQRDIVKNECIFINNREDHLLVYNNEYNKEHTGNILLNYISLKGRISKLEYDSAASRLLQRSNDEDNLKRRIRYSLYDLQNIGYVDYDAEEGTIYINKSSLIIKPTQSGTTLLLVGARDNSFVQEIIQYSKNGSCFIDIQDSINELMPQTILVKFKKPNHSLINDFAIHFNLQFKGEEELFTQFALANANYLSEWEKFVAKTSELNFVSDFDGGEIFDIETLNFKHKEENFDKQISLVRFQNINGYKTIYRIWYLNESYHISELHYGIYLFLYLYREVINEQYKLLKDHGQITKLEYNDKEYKLKLLTNVLFYDNNQRCLLVPLSCALPKYHAIAFTLLSGERPEIQKINNRAYLIYKNVDYLFCNNSLVQTLKQHLIKQ